MKEPDAAGDGSILEGGDKQTSKHERAAFSFVAKEDVKKQQKKEKKKKAGVVIRKVKPWSPVAFKDGKKRSRNTNLLPVSAIPEKRAARKKINFGDYRNEQAENLGGDVEAKHSPMAGETQPTKAVVGSVNGEQELQMSTPQPENTPAAHSGMKQDSDKGLRIPSNGNRGDADHSLQHVTPPGQLTIFGTNTKSSFVKYSGNTLDLANKAKGTKGENIRSGKDQVAVLNPADDEILDMMAAQPLQHRPPSEEGRAPWSKGNQVWNIERSRKETGEGSSGGEMNPWAMHEVVMVDEVDEDSDIENFDEEFPPLTAGRTRQLMKNFETPQVVKIRTEEIEDSHLKQGKEWPLNRGKGQQYHKVDGDTTRKQPTYNEKGGVGTKPSMATVLKKGNVTPRQNEPVTFQPDTIKKIGHISVIDGKPAIYFSGEDTQYLAEKMGRTVVGKFSHSIPSSFQIQKVLEQMKFIGPFNWKYINAKHVAIQLENATDYARLLVGQNGVSVWFVDRHPMRVFRWTTDFNPYFETPIAVVWCNLVGLLIHLFEKSALSAIGGMLGTPIQIDHATATQTRLSYARICVEIDISKPPTEEVILDLRGREVVQKIIWDRIPLYCRECRHVGHASSTCYANGRREKPMKRDFHAPRYNNPPKTHMNGPSQTSAGGAEEGGGVSHRKDKEADITAHTEIHGTEGASSNIMGKEGTREKFPTHHFVEGRWDREEDGFRKQGRRRGQKPLQAKINYTILKRPNSTGQIQQPKNGKNDVGKTLDTVPNTPGGQSTKLDLIPDKGGEVRQSFVKPSYYKLLENGDFEMDDVEEGNEGEDEPPNSLLERADEANPEEETNFLMITGNVEQIDRGGSPSQINTCG